LKLNEIPKNEKPMLAYIAITRMTPLGLSNLPFTQGYPMLITLGLSLTIPWLAFFAFFQRYIVMGLASAAIKG